MKNEKPNTRAIGQVAEELAAAYLLSLGYRVVTSNWHYGHLEIDILAIDESELVVVEVKSRVGVPFEHPSDAITNRKMKMVIEAAEAWITASGWTGDTRFDLITVIFEDFSARRHKLEHFRDAFNASL